MLDALPTAEELEDADEATINAAYEAAQGAYDALEALSPEDQEQITGAEKLVALMDWFNRQITVMAANVESGYWSNTVTYTLDADGKLTLSGSGTVRNNNTVDKSKVISVVIQNGITGIGDYAFYDCSNLSSISIPKGVTSIENYAFYNCSNLSSISIPKGVTSIENYAFYNCSNLSSISIPNSVTSIGKQAFYNCSNLSSISIPNGVTSIGESAFSNCSNLSSISIPKGVTSIGKNAFRNCSNLSSISIPKGVTSIGKNAFRNCSNLSSISIPNSVTSIGDYAFESCGKLETVVYEGLPSEWEKVSVGSNGNRQLVKYLKYMVTFEAPENLTYDGNAKTANITKNDTTLGEITVNYYDQADTKLAQPPVDVGTYTVKITVADSTKYVDAEVGKFTIVQAINSFTDKLAIIDWTWGDSANAPTATAKFGIPTFTYAIEEDGTYTETVPTAVGTYWVKATVVGTENYTGLEAKETFTIVPKTYAITYVSGANGTGTITAGNKTHGVAFTLSADTFTRDGYTQIGWTTTDGGEKVYDLGDSYTVDAAVTLYPAWTINQYTITVKPENGDDDITIKQDYGTTVTAPILTRGGYVFDGWDKTFPTTMPAENMTITAKWKDVTAPTGEIKIGTDSWKTFFNNITFGLFFKDTEEVTITATDNSGENVKIEYLLSDKELTAEELAIATFTAYSDKFSIEPNNEYVIYVKLSDKTGNVTYINSNGIVLDNVAPVISGITNGKTYCEAQTVTVSDKYEVTVTVNGTPVTLDANGQFTLSPASGTQTVVAKDQVGNVSAEMIVTVNDKHEGGTATCTKKAACKHCGLEYGEVESNNHSNLKQYTEKDATVNTLGNIEYWHCEACNKYFTDADCKNEIESVEEAYLYALIFNTDGGNPVVEDKFTVKWQDKVLDGVTAPTKDGYEFIGWKCETAYVTESTEYKALATNKSTASVELTAQWKDITAPTGEITLGTNTWKTFFNNITFGLFFKETQEVTITAADNSGEDVEIEYLLSDKELTAAELATATFTAYSDKFSVEPNNEYVIYAKLSDKTGNVAYINSNGIALDNIAPIISGITNGENYCEAQTVTVIDKYVDTVTVNGTSVTLDANGQFTISPAEGTQIIVAKDQAGNVSAEMLVTVNDGHTYEWQNENGQYWQKCKFCGNETAKKDIPEITINGADKVCKTQDYKFSFNVPEGSRDVTYGYEFENKSDGGIQPKFENGIYSDTIPFNVLKDDTSFTLVVEATTADGYLISVRKDVQILQEHTGGTATCTEKAECEVCNEEYGEADATNHTTLKHIEAKAATTEVKGNIEYWHCEACNKYFSDKACKDEITLADTVIAKLTKTVSDNKSPQTGYNSHISLWFALLFVSGGTLVGTSIYGKKKKYFANLLKNQ